MIAQENLVPLLTIHFSDGSSEVVFSYGRKKLIEVVGEAVIELD